MGNITIVTALFDIGRSEWSNTIKIKNGHEIPSWLKRSNEDFFEMFENMAPLKNEMVIYTESKFFDKILEIRKKYGNENITKIEVKDNIWNDNLFFIERIQSIMNNPTYINFVDRPNMPEHWDAKYVMVNFLKTFFVINAIENNLISNNQIAWIDFHYCRTNNLLPENLEWNYNFDDKVNLFMIRPFDSRQIIDYIKTGDFFITGMQIISDKKNWKEFNQLILNSMMELLSCGLVDDDQTLLLMSVRKNPELFTLKIWPYENFHKIFLQLNLTR